MVESVHRWLFEEFGKVDFRDGRQRRRLFAIARVAVDAPSGKISAMFRCAREREAAYDFFECPRVKHSTLIDGIAMACVERCTAPHVFVAIDGSSLTLTDRRLAKDFGALGSRAKGRGLKVITALAIDGDGTPIGVCDQQWWARQKGLKRTSKAARKRSVSEKETQHWLNAIAATTERFARACVGTRAWFVLDREGNSWPVLEACQASGHLFTIRASRDRRLQHKGTHKLFLRAALERQPVLGGYKLAVAAGPKRKARTANLSIRVRTVTLDLRDAYSHKRRPPLSVTAVWVRESGTTPRGEKPLDWLLLTNADVSSLDDAKRVILSYATRWRIEDFHKTWKSGRCGVEQTQLRRKDHVIKFAVIMAAVAARTERLKHLARTQPETPACGELDIYEVNALIMLKRESKDRLTDEIPSAMPSIADATMWIAQLGGYIRQKSNGPPGSITIGRGLKILKVAAQVLKILGRTPVLKASNKPKSRSS